MPAIGKGNPLPLKIGGGPSSTEQANTVIKQAVGIGGASPDGTIRAEWFLARARGLASSIADERAINQAFPDTTIDHLPVYEEILDTPPAPEDSDQTRRDNNTRKWTSTASAVTADLESELHYIDENFDIVNINRDYTTVTQLGRAFQDENPSDPDASGPPFNIGKQTDYPNYSNEFVCNVNYAVTGAPTANDLKKMEEARAVLRDRLPSWIEFEVFKGLGFFLDIDLLDLGAFGDYPAGTIYPPP